MFSAHRLLEREKERRAGRRKGAVRKKAAVRRVVAASEREEQKDTHSDNDERTRAALMGLPLYLCRRRVPP